jgi:hypothetical protein
MPVPRIRLWMSRTKMVAIGVLIALLSAVTPALVSSQSARADVAAPSWWNGKICDTNNYPASNALGSSYNGVITCGPGPYQGGSDHLENFFAGSWGEYEWECVELVMRYMYLVYGIAPYNSPGGQDVVSNYSGSVLTKVTNPATGGIPSPGDILSFAANTFGHGSTGHTSVVTSVSVDGSGNGTVTTMEQNASSNGVGSVPVVNHVLGGGVTGWLHNPNAGVGHATALSMSGDLNGDGYSDIGIFHQVTSDGADVHSLYGSTGTPFQYTPTIVRHLLASNGWAWSKMKLASGDFNGDGYADVAIVHQTSDGGADVHILYGSSGNPLQNTITITRHLTAAEGWNWSQMKIASGDFNGDGYSDIAILQQVGVDDTDVHILYGGATPFQNTTTFVRHLYAADGFAWSKIKVATGYFNADSYADLAIVHQRSDLGADVDILYGGTPTPFQYSPTFVRSLPNSAGWTWTGMKLASGYFNADSYEDLAIAQQRTDGGADINILYGSTGTPFQYSPTLVRSLTAAQGWTWSEMKLVTGYFNADSYSDLAIVHQRTDGGADVHILYGSTGTPFQYNPTFAVSLTAAAGWVWADMKLVTINFGSDGLSGG